MVIASVGIDVRRVPPASCLLATQQQLQHHTSRSRITWPL